MKMIVKQRFLVSFMVDARGGAMRGCRHSGVRVIIPPRKASSPMRITCRYLKKDKLVHAPPLMEGEALASRILEMGPSAAKFLGPVILEVPHFASLRGKEREIVILRSDNGETWREHTLEATEEAVQEVLNESFDGEELKQLEDLNTNRITRILTTDFPQYFAIVTRIRQEVHAIGPDGGMVSSTVVPQVQAVFPQGALTKKIKVGLQAQPISPELTAKLLGNRVAVSPIVTVEPRRRKFHKSITLTLPVPQAASKGMINQYSGDTPTLRLLCSITGGTTRAQWEDVTGSTQLTFVNDCVSFTTTVSARFWLMDCSNIPEATRMATELYREAIHVPFMSKFLVFAKRHQQEECRLRVFCMTDDREDKTLESQEQFTEVAKSRDVEVMEGKTQFLEFGGNLCPVTKSGDQLSFNFYAFRENRLPFTVRVKDQHADPVGRVAFMRQPKVGRGDAPQNPICNLNIALPESILPEPAPSEPDLLSLEKKYTFLNISKADTIHKADLRLSDISNMLDSDWVNLAHELEVGDSDINIIKSQYPNNEPQQALVMLRLWMQSSGNKATGNQLERGLREINRVDIINQCIFNIEPVTDDKEKAVARSHITDSPEVIRKETDQNIVKETEKAEDDQNKSYQGKGRKDLSPTYEREEKKYAGEEKIVKEDKKIEIKSTTTKQSFDKQAITQELVDEFMKESDEAFADRLKETKMKESVPEKYIGKTEVVEQFSKSVTETVRKDSDSRDPKKEEFGDVPSSIKKDDVSEKDIIRTTTKKFESGSQSIITTKTTERRSFIVDDGSDGEIQEKIVVEKRSDSTREPKDFKEKTDMLQKLGQELGKLDDKLEEKFNEKRKTEEPKEGDVTQSSSVGKMSDTVETSQEIVEETIVPEVSSPSAQLQQQKTKQQTETEMKSSEEKVPDKQGGTTDSESSVDSASVADVILANPYAEEQIIKLSGNSGDYLNDDVEYYDDENIDDEYSSDADYRVSTLEDVIEVDEQNLNETDDEDHLKFELRENDMGDSVTKEFEPDLENRSDDIDEQKMKDDIDEQNMKDEIVEQNMKDNINEQNMKVDIDGSSDSEIDHDEKPISQNVDNEDHIEGINENIDHESKDANSKDICANEDDTLLESENGDAEADHNDENKSIKKVHFSDSTENVVSSDSDPDDEEKERNSSDDFVRDEFLIESSERGQEKVNESQDESEENEEQDLTNKVTTEEKDEDDKKESFDDEKNETSDDDEIKENSNSVKNKSDAKGSDDSSDDRKSDCNESESKHIKDDKMMIEARPSERDELQK